MSIYKRKETWWIQYTAPDGSRIQQSAGTKIKQEAQELHDQLKAQAWREKRLGAKPRYIWEEAVVRWLTEQSHKKSLHTDKIRLRWLHQHLNGVYLDEIAKVKVDSIKSAKVAEGVSNGTVNRTLALLRSILNRACLDWEWLDTIPSVRLLPEQSKRVRWLTPDDVIRLMQELPEHLKLMVRFSLLTGLRESNVTGFRWDQIDMQRHCAWVNSDQAKGKKSISIPLNDEAIGIIRQQIGKHDTHVFTYEGQPVTRGNNHAWRKALLRANIHDFRWHDLRHTWATWHVQNGTPLHVLKELGGWASLDMVLKYAHFSSEHLAVYAGNSKPVTNLRQVIKKA